MSAIIQEILKEFSSDDEQSEGEGEQRAHPGTEQALLTDHARLEALYHRPLCRHRCLEDINKQFIFDLRSELATMSRTTRRTFISRLPSVQCHAHDVIDGENPTTNTRKLLDYSDRRHGLFVFCISCFREVFAITKKSLDQDSEGGIARATNCTKL